jgi:hypothetical protein
MPVPLAAVTVSVFATSYLSAEQAREVLFPGVPLEAVALSLTPGQMADIGRRAGVPVRSPALRLWRGAGGEVMLVDEVIGKHDRITYALGINADGSVRGLEIMDYRENYGHEIRSAPWRAQFKGRSAASALQLDEDIRNISGATLSCRHVTEGVRRLLATWALALKPASAGNAPGARPESAAGSGSHG